MEVKLYQDLLTLNWNLLFSLITVVVLVLVLKHFFFEKVHKFMEERTDQVEGTLKAAEETNRQATQVLADYEACLAGVEEEKRKIIEDAMTEAKVQADSVLNKANKEASQIREKVKREIEQEKKTAKKELEKEIGNLAVLAAGKILEEELDAKKQETVIDKILKEAEVEPWTE